MTIPDKNLFPIKKMISLYKMLGKKRCTIDHHALTLLNLNRYKAFQIGATLRTVPSWKKNREILLNQDEIKTKVVPNELLGLSLTDYAN
jgi:hypothetical protein